MSEFMGLIYGQYDAKTGGGFQPAGASLHNVMSAHGPDATTHEKASNVELKPNKVGEGSMAFMFESCLMVGVTDWGLQKCKKIQGDYNAEVSLISLTFGMLSTVANMIVIELGAA